MCKCYSLGERGDESVQVGTILSLVRRESVYSTGAWDNNLLDKLCEALANISVIRLELLRQLNLLHITSDVFAKLGIPPCSGEVWVILKLQV